MTFKKLKRIQRERFKEIRLKALPLVEKEIIHQVKITLIQYIEENKLKGHLGLYWPLFGEVDLCLIKETFKIPLALPAINKDFSLNYHKWTDSPLKPDEVNILSPIDQPKLKPKDIDLLLIPGLSIDQDGYRLGYGGGFFDRLMSDSYWNSIPCLMVLPNACISKDPLPRDPWDIPLDGWISEEGIRQI